MLRRTAQRGNVDGFMRRDIGGGNVIVGEGKVRGLGSDGVLYCVAPARHLR